MTVRAARAKLRFGWARKLPMMHQAESAECGLACLAMVAGYHGWQTNLAELRRRFGSPERGSTLKELVDIAAQLEFSGRPLRAPLESIGHLQCPCILHWDMDHFVVLKSVRRRYAIIHDPAAGVRRMSPQAFSEHYTGVALELTPTRQFLPTTKPRALRLSDLWSRIIGLKRSLAQVLVLTLLLQLFAVAAPFYMQTVVDDVVLRGDVALLGVLALGFVLLLVIEVGTEALRASILLQLSTRLHLQLAANLFRHLVHLPMNWFQRRHLGDVLSRFSSIDSVRETLSSSLVTAFVDGLMAVIMLVVLLLYNSQLTLVVLAALAVYIALRLLLFRPLRRCSEESIARHALCETGLMESARGIQTIKLFQREHEREGQWQNRLAEAMNADIRVARLGIGFAAANTLLFGLENIIVIYLGAREVMANAMSIGMLFAFMSFKQRFTSAIDGLVDQLIHLLMMGLHLERLGDIALSEREPEQAAGRRPMPLVGAVGVSLQTRNLAFRYAENQPWIFEDLQLVIPAGACVAITGASGTGKSTLLSCLMGLTQPDRGQVLADGTPLTQHPDYRRIIAAVTQNDQLLSGSIAENIACFDQQLNWEKVVHCAQQACIHDSIATMPMQYNTPVGDMGSTLSGGQIQRVMLARALYRGPRILFLDEATSHLDVATERAINKHLAAMNITRVMVAHRPDSIALADHVFELRQERRDTGSRNGAL